MDRKGGREEGERNWKKGEGSGESWKGSGEDEEGSGEAGKRNRTPELREPKL